MRGMIFVTILLAGVFLLEPAHSAQCVFFEGKPYCETGCTILRRWRDRDGRAGINYTCEPRFPVVDDLADALGVSRAAVVTCGIFLLLYWTLLIAYERKRAAVAAVRRETEDTDAETAAAKTLGHVRPACITLGLTIAQVLE